MTTDSQLSGRNQAEIERSASEAAKIVLRPLERSQIDRYLNPPPDFREYADAHSIINHYAADPLIVDAIVEKVLQRIEPQLRELLSQNVLKPVVEAILHGELERKHH